MGSGQFPDFIFGTSGSIKRMPISENSHELKFPEWVNSHTDEYDCYNVLFHGDYVQDPEFYYGGPGRKDDSISRHRVLEVKRRKTNPHKRHAVKSIHSEDGDIIDCIDIYKQPALDHPALKNHSIQMRPSFDPRSKITRSTTGRDTNKKEDSSQSVTSQLWHRSGSCPKGTIPIRRNQKKDALKVNQNHSYGRKKPMHIDLNNNPLFAQANHSLSILLTTGYSYSGAKGAIKTWNPGVELDEDYSTSQISLKSGPYRDFENIESGWAVNVLQGGEHNSAYVYLCSVLLFDRYLIIVLTSMSIFQVNPSVYGDRQTRIFVYWTVDGSRNTGCFDLTCPGFVQTSHLIALGAAISQISNPDDLPYVLIVHIHKWGGEVYSSKVGVHPHTATAMGSGRYSDRFLKNSGYITGMRVSENSQELQFPEPVYAHSDEYQCYDFYYLKDYVPDPEFYYGGPGRNERCPCNFQKSRDGDVIDCVDIYKQPAFVHPALRNHTIQMDTVTQEPKQSFSLRTGPYYDYDCVESEWAVNPGVYGDRQTRFFVNWTADASRNTGCFDLTCPGFVQTNHEIALGSAISSISTPNGVPYEIVVYIFKDPLTNNWWVQLGGKVLGYFPPELFDSLKYQAVVVQWGGEVYSSKVGVHPHTATAMSSGEYANWLARNSGYIRNMRISENSQELKFPEAVSSHTDEYDCYDFYYLNDEDYVDDPEFYFGGPGRNERCP
ncbi:hypothetical protein RJ639_019594 [Escallonia herrerae]|uniref:Neprosin PEP catalytic domain-containing protein n=1 Tax=Escallonia herrerae TaxID=1293975 RepID=A0AA88VA30_9ASTE|nr:hypothetical protein RJ639_019594 [Escallonia herrerae]